MLKSEIDLFWSTYFREGKQNICAGFIEQLNLYFNCQNKVIGKEFSPISKDICFVKGPEITWKELFWEKNLYIVCNMFKNYYSS